MCQKARRVVISKLLAKFFYEQCAGTTAGHMANIPNNPVLFSLIQGFSSGHKNINAVEQEDFIKFLRLIADELESESK